MARTSLIAAIAARPRAALGWFLALHAVLWTLLPALLYANLPLDLIEARVYGREWQLGYDKLPPLPWWLVEIAYRAIGHDAGYYLLGQIAVLAAFGAIYLLARPLVGELRALIAILILDGLHFFNFTAEKFNHDVIQLPFWALAALAFHRALRGGGLGYWALLGLAVGISLWAKYFLVVLVCPMVLFLLLDREARAQWRTPGPYLAAAVALIVAAPHLIWLIAHDFVPLSYAETRAVPSRGLFSHVLRPLTFAAGQLFFLLPLLVIATPLLWRERAPVAAAADAYDRRIVTLLAFGPAATLLTLLALTGRSAIAMWGYPIWLCLSLWMMIVAEPALGRVQLTRIVAIWALVTSAFAIAFVANYVLLPSIDGRYRSVLYPGKALATEISQRFRAATGRPLRYVVARMWEGGNVDHYSPERPQVLIDGDPARAPWIDLADLRRKGAVVLWASTDSRPSEMPAAFRAAAPGAIVQPPFVVPFHRGSHKLYVNWAIAHPQP